MHLLEVAILRQQSLSGALAKAAQEVVDEGVVDRPRDGVGLEPQQTEGVTTHFPVAEVAGDEQQRPAGEQGAHESLGALEIDVTPPVRVVQLPGK